MIAVDAMRLARAILGRLVRIVARPGYRNVFAGAECDQLAATFIAVTSEHQSVRYGKRH
jgi:hypothetical protein